MRDLSGAFARLAQDQALPEVAQRRFIRLAIELGPTAVPLLGRKLLDADERQSSWAYSLLARIGGERVVATLLQALTSEGSVSDDKKALILGLLREVGGEPTHAVTLNDPSGLRQRTIEQLASALLTPADVARAADLLVAEVAQSELGAFMTEIVDVAGAQIAPLVEELLLRDDLERAAWDELVELRHNLGDARLPPAPSSPPLIYRGEGRGGRIAVVAAQRGRPHSDAVAATAWRALVVRINARGTLGAVTYDDSVAAPRGIRRLCDALAAEGYRIGPATVAEVGKPVAEAARRTRAAGERLPRAFFLGRDLVGLYDEHVRRRAPTDPPLATLGADDLTRGLDRLEAGDPAGARPLLEAFVEAQPEHAEARTYLGACLLELAAERKRGDSRSGRPGEAPHTASPHATSIEAEALRHFAAAVRLEPDDPLRQWNLAAAAKRLGKPGACYLALTQFRRRADPSAADETALARLHNARGFIKTFERAAMREHPDSTPEAVARGEELYDRAFRYLEAGRYTDAMTGFEAVLKLVPSHYASWANLGAVYAFLERREDAQAALRRALAFRPDYELAQRNLTALEE